MRVGSSIRKDDRALMSFNMELFEHQKEIIDADPKWCGIFQGTGSAKTRTGLELAEGTTLIIAPKQQKLDETFETNQKKFGIILYYRVVSKEEFRRDWESYPPYDTVIVDEAHYFFGATADTKQVKGVTTPKTSLLFESLLKFTRRYPPKRFYLMTATPASKPMNVWAIGTLLGKSWDFFQFRAKYYIEKKIGYRTIWLPRNSTDLKNKLAQVVQALGFTGQLSDWFDVPEQSHEHVYLEMSEAQKVAEKHMLEHEADPMAVRAKRRTIENGILYDTQIVPEHGIDVMQKVIHFYPSQKIDKLIEYASTYPKLLIFANYTGQIIAIAKQLAAAGHKVLTLTGATKDRKAVMDMAEATPNIIVVAQSSISEGYQFPSCNTVIFASLSWQCRHYIQALGRVLRADAIKKNLYIHLIVKGGMDEACHKAIEAGNDFQEKIMNNQDEVVE